MNLPVTTLLSGSIIDLDGTLFAFIVIFFIGFILLKIFIFDPLLAVFDARDEATEGARDEAKKLRAEVSSADDSFASKLSEVRAEANEVRETLRNEARKQEQEILTAMRDETQKALDEANAQLDKEAASIRSTMNNDIPQIAASIASKLMGREVKA